MNDSHFQTRITQDIHIAEVHGRLDAHQVPEIKKWLKATCDGGANRIVVNLKGVNFIDTRALSLLVTGLKWCQQANGDLHLSNLQQAVQIIFEMTHLNRAFEIFEDEEQAVTSLQTLHITG